MTSNQHPAPQAEDRGYVPPAYLEATAGKLAAVKQRSWQALGAIVGADVLDVGCGIGIDVRGLAQVVGPDGTATGVDHDPAMIEQARITAADAGCTNVRFEQALAHALPFAPTSFAAVRSERLFQHLDNAAAVLAEMARVTRPGGHVVALDTDWGSMSIDCIDPALERRLADFKARHTLANGFAGRTLRRLFLDQGLLEVSVELFPSFVTHLAVAHDFANFDDLRRRAAQAGAVTEAEFDRFVADLAAADRDGTFFASMTLVMVAGTVP